jgi:hypothetical protein
LAYVSHIGLVKQRKASPDALNHRDTELLQPLASPVRCIAGHPDLKMADRRGPGQCLSEAGCDPDVLSVHGNWSIGNSTTADPLPV